jgi:hypothetical protein
MIWRNIRRCKNIPSRLLAVDPCLRYVKAIQGSDKPMRVASECCLTEGFVHAISLNAGAVWANRTEVAQA